MAVHEHLHRHHARNPEPKTYVSVVYVTASPTFTDPVGGYTTPGVEPSSTEQASPTPSASPEDDLSADSVDSSSSKVQSSSHSAKTTLQTSAKSSSALPSSIVPTASVDSGIPLLAASGTTALSPVIAATPTNSAVSEAASSSAPVASADSGMSTGGKAGLAIGIVLLFGAVLAIVAFMFKRRKDAMKQKRLDDEKQNPFADVARTASTRTTASAPRLSLRPVTQFFIGEKRQSRSNLLGSTGPTPPEKNSMWERPIGGQDTNRNNPFGNHAEIDSANANGPPVVNEVSPDGRVISDVAAGAVGGAGAIGLARGASKRAVKPLDFTKQGPFLGSSSTESEVPGTPTLAAGAAHIAAAGGPANSAVHRIQLDFKPSMDDELELKAGQLVRVLHEYDDGWALCIRLDMSRQGVVPRTCLSTRPVQKRGPAPSMRLPIQASPGRSANGSQNPHPMSPGMNGSSPRSPQSPGPMTPNGGPQARSMTPNGPQYNSQQRSTPPSAPYFAPSQGPMTPTNRPRTSNGSQGTPNSPNRSRAGSDAQMQARRNSPPGSSPMNPVTDHPAAGPPRAVAGAISRKPVGQAL